MPPRKGESSTSTVRSPARAAVMAAAVPAEPPPTTTRSASSATGIRSSGTTRVACAMGGLGAGRGFARGCRLSPPEALGHVGHRLEQHVEAGDLRPGRRSECFAVRRERTVQVRLLAGHDRVALAQAGIHLIDERLEPLFALLAEARADHLAPDLREGVGRRHLAPETAGQKMEPLGDRRRRVEAAARGEGVQAREPTDVHGVAAHVIAKDLVEPGAARELLDDVGRRGLTVDWLVNNAGFGTVGRFDRLPVDGELDEICLNVEVLVELTGRCLPAMVARKAGVVMNIASMG